MNTNETNAPEIKLAVEEVEAVIAPGFKWNHCETLEVELVAEEAETIIAPGIRWNHNETFLRS